jgi:hypothetical protein
MHGLRRIKINPYNTGHAANEANGSGIRLMAALPKGDTKNVIIVVNANGT